MGKITIYGKPTVELGGSGMNMYNEIDTSFKTIYNDLFRFRKVWRDDGAGVADQLFYNLDQPGHYYFKLFFYFANPYSGDMFQSNLLLGTEYEDDNGQEREWTESNALDYLYNNMEYTRFNHLSEFIQLLSDVSTKSPWYFQQITGLDTALDRQEISGRDFKIDEERKTISIKCLADAYDNRIGRLLDLYRSVVYSQSLHKWILPANLRKFDMGIYIFNSPIKTISGGRIGLSDKIAERVLGRSFEEYYGNDSEDSVIDIDQTMGQAEEMYAPLANLTGENTPVGSKYIELRGCEIDYNSSKSAYSELDNAEGKPQEYEIVLHYDSAYEDRHDPIFKTFIGDFVIEDLLNGEHAELNEDGPYTKSMDNNPLVDGTDGGTIAGGVIGDPFGTDRRNSLLESAVGMGAGYLNTIINKVMLGNIYGFSLSKLDNLVSQDPMSLVRGGVKEAKNAALIYKRITDFTNPNKGRKELNGKNLYDSNVDLPKSKLRTQAISWVSSQILGNPSETQNRTINNPSSTVGNNFGDSSTPPNSPESLNGRTLRRPETDTQDIDWSLDGKNLYHTGNGWIAAPSQVASGQSLNTR